MNKIPFRTYFRIQRKHQTCSKRASYLGNTSWSDSSKLMRLLSIHDNWSKQVMQWHRPFMVYCFFMVCYNFLFHLIDFENVGNGRRRNLDNFYFFFLFPKKVTVTPSKCKIYRKNKKKQIIWKVAHHGWAPKFLVSRTS